MKMKSVLDCLLPWRASGLNAVVMWLSWTLIIFPVAIAVGPNWVAYVYTALVALWFALSEADRARENRRMATARLWINLARSRSLSELPPEFQEELKMVRAAELLRKKP